MRNRMSIYPKEQCGDSRGCGRFDGQWPEAVQASGKKGVKEVEMVQSHGTNFGGKKRAGSD